MIEHYLYYLFGFINKYKDDKQVVKQLGIEN